MKKYLIIALLVLFSLSFAFANPQKEDKEIELNYVTWWVGADTKGPMVEKLVNEFNEAHKGKIHVTIQGTADADGLENSINTQIAAGTPPDSYNWRPTISGFDSWYGSSVFMDFTNDLKGEWSQNFADGILEQSTYNGATKSLPFEMAYTPVWYNTDILKAAGVNKIPETIDEFWAMCNAVKAAGYYPTAQMTGGNNAWTSMLWYTFLCGSIGGPDVFNNFDKEFGTNPVFVQAAEMLKRMFVEYSHTDALGGDAGVAGGHYLSGQTAAFINGPWYIGRVEGEAPSVASATKMAFFPGINYDKIMVSSTLTNFAAANTKDAKRRAAVIEFLKFMTSPENAKRVAEDSGAVLAVKFDSSYKSGSLSAQVQDIINQSKGFVNYWQFYVSPDVLLEFGQALSAMVQNRITPAQFVKQIASYI